MKTKDLKINFRYLVGNIACLSVDSIDGKSIHNDINNEEAIIIFNSLVGEKENCQTVKTLLKENQELKEKLDKYENPKDMTLFAMWCTEKVKDENQTLKKQLENKYEKVGTLTGELLYEENTKLINQQKAFIEWLESGINQVRNTEFLDERIQRAGLVAYNRVLSKYKEIIGGIK